MGIPKSYEQMNKQQRAKFLLSQGVKAKLDIDPSNLCPAFVPLVKGVGVIKCGYFQDENAAISAGVASLHKAMQTEG